MSQDLEAIKTKAANDYATLMETVIDSIGPPTERVDPAEILAEFERASTQAVGIMDGISWAYKAGLKEAIHEARIAINDAIKEDMGCDG